MNAMNLIDVITLGVVEGLTEFLPVSSTGHMILTAALLKLENTAFLKSFEVAIQLGAIFAIILLYFKRLFNGWAIYQRLFVAFIPTATVGFVMYKLIKKFLFSPVIVSISLILGGILLIALNRWIEESPSAYEDLEDMPLKSAFWIGMMQCLAMVPGVSRAGATIIGGILNGCNKRQATEFSFLLAIPTMLAATGYDLLKNADTIDQQGLIYLGVGGVTAFIAAWFAVKVFLNIVTRYGFAGFGYYRIAIGVAFLVLLYGMNLQLAA